VLATLREYLEGIDVLQEPARQFVMRVDHRYDRLLGGQVPVGASKV